jgi:hypothetical protein
LAAAVWAASWAVALPSCGGDSTADRHDGATTGAGGGSASGSLALEDLAEAAAPALCAYYDRCFGPLMSYLGGSDCVAAFRAQLEEGSLTYMAAAVDAGRLEYDGRQAAACLAAFPGLDCSTNTTELAPCDGMLRGLVTEGNPCRIREECAAGLFCALDAACPGTCRPRAAIGGPCTAYEHCAEELACDFSTQLCVTAIPESGSCSADGSDLPPCTAGTYCDPTTGTCRSSATMYDGAEGEACGYAAAPIFCRRGLYCIADPDASVAESAHCASAGFGAGAACRASIPDACPEGSYCAIPDDATDGTCQPLPGDGAPCTADQTCSRGLVCATDTCRAPAHLGETCLDHEQCYSQNCAGGVCVASDPCVD